MKQSPFIAIRTKPWLLQTAFEFVQTRLRKSAGSIASNGIIEKRGLWWGTIDNSEIAAWKRQNKTSVWMVCKGKHEGFLLVLGVGNKYRLAVLVAMTRNGLRADVLLP